MRGDEFDDIWKEIRKRWPRITEGMRDDYFRALLGYGLHQVERGLHEYAASTLSTPTPDKLRKAAAGYAPSSGDQPLRGEAAATLRQMLVLFRSVDPATQDAWLRAAPRCDQPGSDYHKALAAYYARGTAGQSEPDF